MASFISSTEISESREEKKNAWKKVLAEEEAKYMKKQRNKERRKERGEDKWMLPGVEARLKLEPDEKHKKHKSKKSKKSKKKKKKRKSSSSESDSSGGEWEEKGQPGAAQSMEVKQPTMNMDFMNLPTFSRKDIQTKSRKEIERENAEKLQQEMLAKREINPFWKKDGAGSAQNETKPSNKQTFEQDWLLRSLKRMKEEAKDSGRSLEEVAADRYGSWEKFEKLLGRDKATSHLSKEQTFMKPSFNDDDDDEDHKRSRKRTSKYSSKSSWKKQKKETHDDMPITKEMDTKPEFNISKNVEKAALKGCSLPPETTKKASISEKHTIEKKSTKIPAKILTDKEKNQLAAKILKAELMGNTTLATKLKTKLENSKKAEEELNNPTETKENEESSSSASSDEELVVLTHTSKDGTVWPVKGDGESSTSQRKKKKKKVVTHGNDRERERYFADDDRYSLKELVEREKTSTAEDQDEMFSRLATKEATNDDDYTLDDMFVSQAARQTSKTQEDSKRKQQAMASHRKLAKTLDKCNLCFGNPQLPKHLIVCIGKKAMLMLPSHMPLTEGHCTIVPMYHTVTGTGLDEDVWSEILQFMKSLVRMFQSRDMDCVFMQTCMNLSKSRHFFVDCIPLERELGDMAPIYFKKAIQESDTEWSQNKKLVDTRSKGVRQCIPKGLPYFSVDFGTDGGFAHVIEDERVFPWYFGREIVGGMMDVEPRLWRKPPLDHFPEQTKRSLQFAEWWKDFDFTN